MCLTPITLVRKVRTMQGSPTDIVPCGLCPKCLKRHLESWAFRLIKEYEKSTSATMITLQYDDEHLPKNKYLKKKDCQEFFQRLRNAIPNSGIKYYLTGEYGSEDFTERPHYHLIIFNLPQQYIQDWDLIKNLWQNGYCYQTKVEMGTIKYTLKYLMKPKKEINKRPKEFREFSLMSKKMGIHYLTPQMVKHHQDHLKSYVTLEQGQKQTLPRYFRDKIFTKDQKDEINKTAAAERQIQIETLFDNNYQHISSWTQDQFRKSAKLQRLASLQLK